MVEKFWLKESYIFSHFDEFNRVIAEGETRKKTTSLIILGTSREIRPSSNFLFPVTTVRALETFLQVRSSSQKGVNELQTHAERPFLFGGNFD